MPFCDSPFVIGEKETPLPLEAAEGIRAFLDRMAGSFHDSSARAGKS